MATSTTLERKIINAKEERKIKFLDDGLDISKIKHGDILDINDIKEFVDITPIKNLNLLTTWSRGPLRINKDEGGNEGEEKTVIWKNYEVIKNAEGYILNQLIEGIFGQFSDVSERLSYRDGERYLDEAGL